MAVVTVVGTGFVAGLLHPRYSRAEWFSFLAFGLTIGAIYALIALGCTMVYGILRMVNFAHGDVFMFGAYAACFSLLACNRVGFLGAYPALSFAIATAACIAVSAGIAVLAERIAYRPFRRGRSLAPLISTLGLSFVLVYSARRTRRSPPCRRWTGSCRSPGSPCRACKPSSPPPPCSRWWC